MCYVRHPQLNFVDYSVNIYYKHLYSKTLSIKFCKLFSKLEFILDSKTTLI